MADSRIDVVVHRLTAVDHETVHELHGLGSLATELAGDDDFATLGTALHDETKDTVACSVKQQNEYLRINMTEVEHNGMVEPWTMEVKSSEFSIDRYNVKI